MANIPGMHGQIPGGDPPIPINIFYNGQIVLKTDSFGGWIECDPKNRINAAIGIFDQIKKELSWHGYAIRDDVVLPEHYFDVGPFRITFIQDKPIEEQFSPKSKTIKSIEYKHLVSYSIPGWSNHEDIIRVQKQNELMEPIVNEIIYHIKRLMKLTPFW